MPPATRGLDGARAPRHRGCTHATPAPTSPPAAIHTPPSLAHPLSRSHTMTHARRACARARAHTHTSISGPLRITPRSAQREPAHLPAYEYTGRAPRAEPGVQGSVRSAWQCTPQRQACKVYVPFTRRCPIFCTVNLPNLLTYLLTKFAASVGCVWSYLTLGKPVR